MVDLSDELVPFRRPHFDLRDRQLFFLLSSRAHAKLDPEDAALWERMNGVATVGALRRSIPDLDGRLKRLWELHVCELVRPCFPPGRRRVLVVEPHMDDAVLSVGGSMWRLREACEITVVTLAGRSNFTSYFLSGREFFDVGTVSALRKAESTLAMRLLGGSHAALDLPEAPLRCHAGEWTLDWYRRHRKVVDGFIAHAPSEQEVEEWASAIECLLADTEAEEIWLPLGVGSHTDHELTRNASLRALSRLRGIERHKAVFFYQDVPYAHQFPGHTEAVVTALRSAGAELHPHLEDIRSTLEQKQRLVSVFASQFKASYMAPRVEVAARHCSGSAEGRSELRFRVGRLPEAPDVFAMYSGRDRVGRLLPALASWWERHRSAARIRVVTVEPVPRWEENLAVLREAFPAATLELHTPAVHGSEKEGSRLPGIDVRPVPGGVWARLARLSHVALDPGPLIVLTGEVWERYAAVASLVLFRSDVLQARRMNDVALALRVLGGSRNGASIRHPGAAVGPLPSEGA